MHADVPNHPSKAAHLPCEICEQKEHRAPCADLDETRTIDPIARGYNSYRMSLLTLDRTWERVLGAGRARARSVLFILHCLIRAAPPLAAHPPFGTARRPARSPVDMPSCLSLLNRLRQLSP